jgi:hypothetical protein
MGHRYGDMPHKLLFAEMFANCTFPFQMVRLTIRATDESLPPVLLKLMQDRITTGYSTSAPEKPTGPTPREISHSFSNIMVPSSGDGE